jgi:hypothetical protein
MEVYTFTNKQDALDALSQVNSLWGFCAPGMVTCYSEDDVYWHTTDLIWYIEYSEYTSFLGTPDEVANLDELF